MFWMRRYIIRRVLEMIPTTLGILLVTFVLFHVVGGSPAQVVLGKNATPASLAAFDAKFGYDKPLFCGLWSGVRVLEDGRSAAGLQTNGALRLAYALPAGTYRLEFAAPPQPSGSGLGTGLQTTLQVIDGQTHEIRRVSLATHGGTQRVVFTVPDGWHATDVRLTGTAPDKLRLRRRMAGFFDSQLVHFLGGLAHGDLGMSADYGQSVWQVLRRGVGPSLAVTVPILVGGTLLALMLGLLCAMWRAGTLDRVILLVSTLLMSVNYVVWVLLGQYLLAFRLRLFPIWGFADWTYVLLPVLIGIAGGLGRDIRFFRAVMLDEIYKPYVRTAWAKGLSRSQVMLRHVLRNSLSPVVTYVSLSIPFLFTGSLLLESFYGIPGLGCVSLNALHSSDMAVVRAVVIIGALLYQVVNLLTDLCYAWLDPRVRLT